MLNISGKPTLAVGCMVLYLVLMCSVMLSPPDAFSLLEGTELQARLQSAVNKAGLAPTQQERLKMTAAMQSAAKLLSTEFLYNIVAKDEKANPHKQGFVPWVHALSDRKALAHVERRVREAIQDKNSPYAAQIRHEIPPQFRNLIPALSSETAHAATEASFEELKSQMVRAGEWDRGYLEHGNNLVGNPLTFHYKYKGNKEALSKACRDACGERNACRGYTYHPLQGVCYLKTTASPVRGVDCTVRVLCYARHASTSITGGSGVGW